MIPFAIELVCIAILCAIAAVIAVVKLRDYAIRREEGRLSHERNERRRRIKEDLERLTICRFSCGAKAVKLGAREADLVSIGCAHGKIEPIREGDVLLNCTGTCNEFGYCPLKKIVADPMRFALALKAISEPLRKTEADDSHGDRRPVRYDDPGVPALASVCLRLGIKGFIFDDNGQLGFWCPPAPYPSEGSGNSADNGNQEENRPVPSPDKV